MSVMERLAGASVLIIGMNGLGVEVAKNIVLANVMKVTLADDRIASWGDLGTHFYLQPEDVGRTNRAEACCRSIKDVNSGVDVACWSKPISEELLAAHDAVCVCDTVCSDGDGPVTFKWNDFCRSRGISFIRCEARGVFGYVFDDFASPGSSNPGVFRVPDPGQSIAHVTNSSPAVVTIDRPSVWGSLVGKTVRFSGVQGMAELNNVCGVVAAQEYKTLFGNERQLIVTLSDVDSSNMGAYRNGGSMTVAPFETVYEFTSFRDAWLGGPAAESNPANIPAQWPLIGDHGQSAHAAGLLCEANGLPNRHITRMLRAAFMTLDIAANCTLPLPPGEEDRAIALVDDICRSIQVPPNRHT